MEVKMDRTSKTWDQETSIEAIAVLQLRSDKSLNKGIGSGNVGERIDVSTVKVVEFTALSGG